MHDKPPNHQEQSLISAMLDFPFRQPFRRYFLFSVAD